MELLTALLADETIKNFLDAHAQEQRVPVIARTLKYGIFALKAFEQAGFGSPKPKVSHKVKASQRTDHATAFLEKPDQSVRSNSQSTKRRTADRTRQSFSKKPRTSKQCRRKRHSQKENLEPIVSVNNEFLLSQTTQFSKESSHNSLTGVPRRLRPVELVLESL